MKKSTRIFIVISIFLACSDFAFVVINYRAARGALADYLGQSGRQIESAFRLSLADTCSRMLQIATFVAGDQRIQQAFFTGRRAVEAEGGGPGGVEAAAARRRLHELTAGSHREMARRFDFRQLHFHLPPGSTSFLRVHQPERYGDNMDEVRHTVVAVNRRHEPASGFETGRIYSGIRGVVPVTARDPESGTTVHVGAVEAGTSFQHMLENIAGAEGIDLAVLLTMEHLEENVWPKLLAPLVAERGTVRGFMVEAATGSQTAEIIGESGAAADRLLADGGTGIVIHHGIPYQLTAFPLRDYAGSVDGARPDVGRVVAIRGAGILVGRFRHDQHINIIFAVCGYLAVEFLLFAGIRITTRKLEDMVDDGRRELAQVNTRLQDDIERRMAAEKEREALIDKLQASLAEVRTLSGLLPICAWCKKIRDDRGYWTQVEEYVAGRSDAEFSHSICDECMKKHFPDEG